MYFQPPRVVTLAPLILEGRASLVTITKSVLHVNDPDNPADVLVMVLEPPRHGRLTRLHGDRPLARFKLEELSREHIQYVHDGSEEVEDGVVLQVNDGHSYRNILLQVRIVQKDTIILQQASTPATKREELLQVEGMFGKINIPAASLFLSELKAESGTDF
ncbi:hypothetical protein XENOCAPTIV_024463 [Xenoophorus captivus]|uniref:Uncharacterized protein n=1 Tax=Xenoophorus captivus TaxID=1517983 RepID=A0ABV0RF62_9TELE